MFSALLAYILVSHRAFTRLLDERYGGGGGGGEALQAEPAHTAEPRA